MKSIDLNCDLGESPEAIADGTQEALMQHVTSVNIACGGHAGDESTMRATIDQALKRKLAIGAHPGYADLANFGRIELKLSAREISDSVFEQIQRLARIAAYCGASITHVKAHGALYNLAAREPAVARAIADGVARWRTGAGYLPAVAGNCSLPETDDIVLVGLAGSFMLEAFRSAGFKAAAEAFADRRYEPDGTLRPRKVPDALIANPAEAAAQALSIAQRGVVTASDGVEIPIDAQTICIHSDTSDAPRIAAAVAASLSKASIVLRAL